MPSPSAPRCVLLLVAAGALAAQEHATRPRPVPGLAAAQRFPIDLPRKCDDAGAGVVFAARAAGGVMLSLRDGELQETSLLPAPVRAVILDRPVFVQARHSLQIGDFDGDGSEEVLARTRNGPAIVRANAPLREGFGNMLADARDDAWFSGCAFDWFGDGRAAVAIVDGGRVVARRRPLAKDGTIETLVDLGDTKILAGTAGDFDRDGLPDLLLALPERGFVWCRHEGTRTAPRFSAPMPLWPAEPDVLVTFVLLFPIDDDPWPDLVVGRAIRSFGNTVVDFTMYEPRLRTATEEVELCELERQAAESGDSAPRLPGALRQLAAKNGFAKTLEQQRREDRIYDLRWRDVPMAAGAPFVHYRASPR